MKDKRPDLAKIAELEDMLLDNPVEYDAEFDAFRRVETREGAVVTELLVRVFLRVDPHSIGNILIYTDQREPILWTNDGIPTEVRVVTRTKRGVILSTTDWIPLEHNRSLTFHEGNQSY
jgi:hypothetical protein